MQLDGTVAVVTGGARGIGRALAEALAAAGSNICVADLDGAGAEETAAAVRAGGGKAVAVAADVSDEQAVKAVVAEAERAFGPVDLFASNAGLAVSGGVDVRDEAWELSWQVNLMAHVYAARAVLPGMLARGHGYLLQTASAAGLLSNIGAAPYTVTKHASVALAEWLSITYGDRGIGVSCVCPQAVDTAMLREALGMAEDAAEAVLASGGVLSPAQVAAMAVEAVREERFLVLPHPEVADYMARRGTDHEKWLAGMRRLASRQSRN